MKHTNFFQEMEKNDENVPSPKKRKLRISTKKKVIPSSRFLVWNHQSIINNVCAYFQKKPNGSKEIEKNIKRKNKKYCKMASRRGLAVKTFFSAVSTRVMLKKSLQTFMYRI